MRARATAGRAGEGVGGTGLGDVAGLVIPLGLIVQGRLVVVLRWVVIGGEFKCPDGGRLPLAPEVGSVQS